MLLLLAVVLAIAWLLGFAIFHVAHFAIHLLIIAAVAFFIIHLVRGTTAPTRRVV